MSDGNEYFNKYSQKAADGHDVDARGYDKRGVLHYGQYNYKKNSSSNSNSSSGSSNIDSTGIVWLVGIGIVGFIVIKVIEFIQKYWIYIVAVLAVCIVCAIVCFIIHIKARSPGLKIFFTILPSVGLICLIIYLGFDSNRYIYYKPQNKKVIEKTESTYAYVIPDALNVRNGPSVEHGIVGSLIKDARIEVIDNSESWWRVKSEDIDGYVYSEYLRNE